MDRNGDRIRYQYDQLGLPIEEQWIAADDSVLETIVSVFDTPGRMILATDSNTSVGFVYDAFSNVTSESTSVAGFSGTSILAFDYNALLEQHKRSLAIGGNEALTDSMQYSSFGELEELRRGGPTASAGGLLVQFAYDSLGRIKAADRYVITAAGVTDRIVQTDYTSSPMGRITGVTHRSNDGTFADYDLRYSPSGNAGESFVQTIRSQHDPIQTYRHDTSGQLISADGFGDLVSFDYDSTGNRDTITDNHGTTTYTNEADNRQTGDGTFVYAFDDEGHRISKFVIDPNSATNGYLSDGRAAYQAYEWDHRGRLTDIVTLSDDTAIATELKRVTYTYDPLDRRVAKEVVENSIETLAERFVHDGNHLLAVANRSGEVTEQFLHGPMVDQVLAEEYFDSTTGAREEVYFTLGDHQGTIRDTVVWDDALSAITGTSHIEYSAYGEELANDDPTIEPRFGYTGRDRDTESDLQYNRARYYDATLGRWISQDPIGFEAGDANLYRYVGNGPTNASDPYGLWEVTRSGGRKATAVAEAGDTIRELARDIGLDAHEYKEWLSIPSGSERDLPGLDESLEHPNCDFEIPNSVVTVWAGEGGLAGRLFVSWRKEENYLRSLGFRVRPVSYGHPNAQLGPVAVTSDVVYSVIEDSSSSKELHGIYGWGHGAIGYFGYGSRVDGLPSVPT
jgi:RHS repeat-associated protein